MEHYKTLTNKFDLDNFNDEKYYTLEDLQSTDGKVKANKNVKKVAPPKKKRTPVKKSDDSDEEEDKKPKKKNKEKEKKSEEKEEAKGKDSDEKKKKKVYPVMFNRNAKTMIDFIVGRFLWEVYFIEPDGEECPETKDGIEKYLMNAITSDWTKPCNILQLVIHSVNIFQPGRHIENSHGIDKYIRNKFRDNLENSSFVNFAADYITEFMKLVMLKLANRFWLEKTQTCNKKILENVLRDIELVIPVDCQTVSNGLMEDIYNYDTIMNPIKEKSGKVEKSEELYEPEKKTKKGKSEKKTTDKKTDDKEDKKDKAEKRTSDKENKKEKKTVKKPITRNSRKDDYEFNDELDESEEDNSDGNETE